MAEKKKLIDSEAIVYSGLFNLTDLYKLIDTFLTEKSYSKLERFNEEKITAEGKDIDVLLEPSRTISDYAKHVIKVRLYVKGMKEVEVEKDGVKVKLNQGKVRIEFSAFLITDTEGKWNDTAPFIIFRALVDKYIYKFPLKHQENDLIEHTRHLKSLVKSFLNLHRY